LEGLRVTDDGVLPLAEMAQLRLLRLGSTRTSAALVSEMPKNNRALKIEK
jgi:hypothetical protein